MWANCKERNAAEKAASICNSMPRRTRVRMCMRMHIPYPNAPKAAPAYSYPLFTSLWTLSFTWTRGTDQVAPNMRTKLLRFKATLGTSVHTANLVLYQGIAL